MKPRFLFTGITSIHGWPLFNAFREKYGSSQVIGIRSPKMKVPHGPNVFSCCINNKEKMEQIRKEYKPTHIIHCAGVCDLDVCEERPDWAHSMNTAGTQLIAETFAATSRIIYMSSDLVFSGKETPLNGYSEESIPDPLTVAGKTIAAAESVMKKCRDYLVIRLGLPIGASVTGDKGAIDFIESRLKKQLPVTLFHDEWRSCIRCDDIAEGTLKLSMNELQGVLNLGGPVKYSLYEIGEWVLKRSNYNPACLKGILRKDEVNGPPRMGDVSLNSEKAAALINFVIKDPFKI